MGSGGGRQAAAVATFGGSEVYLKQGEAANKFLDDKLNSEAKKARAETEALRLQQLDMANKAAGDKSQADKEAADAIAKEQAGLEQGAAKKRQAKLAQGASGRSDTILTGPLGLTSYGPRSGKTLLGS